MNISWSEKDKTFLTSFFLLFALATLIVSIIILSCVPPVSKDALIHHLVVPKLYLKKGGMHEIPSMVFSYYPMNLDLLYLIPLYFGNDIVPKFIHFSFALLTAWLIFNYLRSRLNTHYALFGVIFFLSIPIIVKLSINVYVDLGLIFFSAASLFLILRWVESGFHYQFLILSAIFCGLAMGTKYNGLVIFFLLTLFVPFLYSRYKKDKRNVFLKPIGLGLFFFFIAILIFSPWMIRNYLWTENPIFPLYHNLFNPQVDSGQESIGLFTYRALAYKESWWQMALLPVRIFFQGQDGNPQYFDGKLNPFLLLLPFFAFCQVKDEAPIIRVEKKILIVFALLYFAFAFFSRDLRMRYISPIIVPLVILSVFGIEQMFGAIRSGKFQTKSRAGLALILGIIGFFLWLNGVYVFQQFQEVKPFVYLNGTLSRDEYIERYRPEYPTMRYINSRLPIDARLLFIFLGNRGYYCERDYVFDMNQHRSTLHQLVKHSNRPEEILHKLREMGISHLIIHYNIFNRWVKMNFTEKDKKLLRQFFVKYVKKLYFKWGYGVSQLENLTS